ncbi:MAG: hypothetical protein U0136_02055 [Bdellovibrionota bacterium]
MSPLVYREEESSHPLEILRLWFPLALTWVAMSAEGPTLASFVARLPREVPNLAAWGVSISLIMVCESPILSIISAAIALARNRRTYLALRWFTFLHCIGCTCFCVALLCDPMFSFVSEHIMGLDREVRDLVFSSFCYFIPCPFAVGYRRLYQGILVRAGQSRLVALGTVGRFLVMILFASLLYRTHVFAGCELASISITAGLIFEALFAGAAAKPAVRALLNNHEADETDVITLKDFVRFYYPLALSVVVALSIVPVITVSLSRARDGIIALAVFPVLNAFTQVFRSTGYAYQEVAVAFASRGEVFLRPLRNVALGLSAALVGMLTFIAFIPQVSMFWFVRVSGLSTELSTEALLPLQILCFSPALSVWICYQRGVYVAKKRTEVITASGFIELVGIALSMYLLIAHTTFGGVTSAAFALVIGGALSIVWFELDRAFSTRA